MKAVLPVAPFHSATGCETFRASCGRTNEAIYAEHVEVLGSSKKLDWLFVCSFHYRDFVFCQAIEVIDEAVDFTLFGGGVGEWVRFLG